MAPNTEICCLLKATIGCRVQEGKSHHQEKRRAESGSVLHIVLSIEDQNHGLKQETVIFGDVTWFLFPMDIENADLAMLSSFPSRRNTTRKTKP
jgi:hypothetical protein